LTLNYDDLIDRAGEWYDGFNPPMTSDRFGTFDLSGFPAQSAKHPAVLLHLHGSVRFDFPPMHLPTLQSGEIVRHIAPVRGIGGTLQGSQGIAQPLPIIAGDGKDQWMTRACIPFGYYYNAFITSILDCPRLLVAGYGAADLHVNSWLQEEHLRIHGARRRIVHINPALLKSPRSRELLTLGESEGNFPPQDPNQMIEIISHLKKSASH
jgi:SIR2-like domain